MDQAMAGSLSGERYTLLGEIGRGRRAAVFAARDTLLDRRVAIKRALRSQDEALLLEEARRLARVGSPRVVRLLDVLPGPPFGLVLELFEGQTLRERSRDSNPIAAAETMQRVEQLLEALVDLHAAALVHGDIKPENIACPADGGPVRLLDVGVLGDATALYAAPEASPGRTPVASDDVYAVAVVAFELVCGRPPFDASDAAELAVRKRSHDAPTASSVGATPGSEVESWLLRALARDPE